MASLQSLSNVKDLVGPIADINFFVNLDNSSTEYSDQQLAKIIQAKNYDRVKDKVDKFKERCEQKLLVEKKRVDDKEEALREAQAKADHNRQGNPPSKLFLDRKDANAVNRYNEKIDRYNNELDLHRRLIDQRDRAQERYEDALDTYKEREADLREQIVEKEEELKPAIDSDIVSFLGKLQQLVYDCFHNKSLIFESFIMLFMAKVSYVFLYDRIESSTERNNANSVFKQLTEELDLLVKGHQNLIKQGFIELVEYINQVYKDNENIFNDMQVSLDDLPYNVCNENEETAQAFLALPIDTNFEYQNIIDPSALAEMSGKISQKRKLFTTKIEEIDIFINGLEDVFSKISGVLSESKNRISQMHANKDKNLGEAFEHAKFILGVFEEEVQDEYLKQQQDILEAIQLDIETAMGVNLPQLLKIILETRLLTVSAEEAVQNNLTFAFLETKPKLLEKSRDFNKGIKELDSHLSEIDEQPRKYAEKFRTKAQYLLGSSIFPLGNLVTLVPLHQELKKFSPALNSQSPAYVDLRQILESRFNIFFITHAVVAVLIAGGIFAVNNRQIPMVGALAGTYAVSSGFMYSKRKQLSN
mgnify:CR=1 FL=1